MNMLPLRFSDAAQTHVGKVRKNNEDNFLAQPLHQMWCVADGMGGHANGRRAADLIIEALGRLSFTGDFNADVSSAADAVHAANAEIWRESEALGEVMGSTVAVLMTREDRFAVLWAGDSRVYLLRAGQLHRLTSDHTQVQEMIDRGLVAAEDAKGHPLSNILSRAVGVRPKLELDAITDFILDGDVFLLCSDGLYGMVSEADISARMSGRNPRTACEDLIALSLENGARDNVTVIAVACEFATVPPFAPKPTAPPS